MSFPHTLGFVSQGVVAFLQGDSGKASGLLIRASEEAKTLRPSPALASRLMQQWRAVKSEALQPKARRRWRGGGHGGFSMKVGMGVYILNCTGVDSFSSVVPFIWHLICECTYDRCP